MSLRARIDKRSRELAFGELFDGVTMEELAASGCFGDTPNENARPGLKRCARFQGILIIRDTLREADWMRYELAETEAGAVFRGDRGWPIAVTPERRCDWEARIAEAEKEAVETRAEFGFTNDATLEEIWERLLEFGTAAGLTDKEMKSLAESLGSKSAATIYQLA